MRFGLAKGRPLEPGSIGLTIEDLPTIPDDPAKIGEARVDPRMWFDQPNRPLELEIGPGKGAFLVHEAERRPDVNLLGVEQAREFFLYAADRCRRRALRNVRVLHADAVEFLRWRVPDEVFSVIHLYFNDPWPKPKHHKKRVVQDRFLADALRTLVPGGEIRIITDHDDYWRWMEDHFVRWSTPATQEHETHPAFDERPYLCLLTDEALARIRVADDEDESLLVATNYERKYAQQGRPFHAAVLRKRSRR